MGIPDKDAKANPLMKYFTSQSDLGKMVREVAEAADLYLPAGSETTAGLRKLLEAVDCFDRARA